MANLPPITMIRLFLFFLTYYSGFFFQFKAYIIYCFHIQLVFDLVLDVLILVYAPRVYLLKVKVKIIFNCFFCTPITTF